MSATACRPVSRNLSSARPQPMFTLMEAWIVSEDQYTRTELHSTCSLTLCWRDMPCPDCLEMTTVENKNTLRILTDHIQHQMAFFGSCCVVGQPSTVPWSRPPPSPKGTHTLDMSSSWFARCALQWTQLYRLWHSSGIKSWNFRLPMVTDSRRKYTNSSVRYTIVARRKRFFFESPTASRPTCLLSASTLHTVHREEQRRN